MEFKKGDHVRLIRHPEKTGLVNKVKIWYDMDKRYKVTFGKYTDEMFGDVLELDVQHYRDLQLNKILDEF